MSIVQSFPTLYAIDKNSKIKVWTAAVRCQSDSAGAGVGAPATSVITHGYINGKRQTATREYTTGKNIGKSNETSPLDQCISETLRKWTDKKEKEGYSETKPADCGEGYGDVSGNDGYVYGGGGGGGDGGNGDDDNDDDDAAHAPGPFLPMLAQTFQPNDVGSTKKKKVITFPCFVQPKLDGLRCVSYATHQAGEPTIALQSRTGAFFTGLPHIAAALRPYLSQHPSIVIDGELYTDQMPFEELAGLIKKKKITDADTARLKKVKYHVYDIYDRTHPNMPYSERLGVLFSAVRRCSVCVEKDTHAATVILVRTEKASGLPDFRRMFSEFVEAGYEGIMLRNAAGVYSANYRSNDLQKYKEFLEDEYRIIGFKKGEGRDAGAVIWLCETDDGKEFTVRPRGTMEQRREWFNEGKKHVGSHLTVVYQELTDDGKPRFPVGKAIRKGY